MYNIGGTIFEILNQISTKEILLPAIQREFVWGPDRIEKLFDSLMQGYPFGTFLYWKVESESVRRFKFYDFIQNYHERDAAHCPELGPITRENAIAILDGQQRLTSLNIGLRGSMAHKRPNKRWTNPDAFPVTHLYLDLLWAPDPGEEQGRKYRFKFLTAEQAAEPDEACWFKVSDILSMAGGPTMLRALTGRGLEADRLNVAYDALDRLFRVVHNEKLIAYYQEQSQDLERVLNIFIRLNSGAVVLSYSDLLLSIATAQWTRLDARSEIHRLVDDLNRVGARFNLSKDFVLKAGLMLTDIASVGFKVENFTQHNMALLEANWEPIRRALTTAVNLVSDFGYNEHTLRADSALLPIAYYIYHHKLDERFLTHSSYGGDRNAIRVWLAKSLAKASGIWGSGLDTLLTHLRTTIKEANTSGFPTAEIETAMRQRGKSLVYDASEIDDLLDLQYRDRRTFPLLTLLYPFVDLKNQFHVDHVCPISGFTATRLKREDVPEDDIVALQKQANSLPNLQILEGHANTEKQATPPHQWLPTYRPDPVAQQHYRDLHDLGELPTNVAEFQRFYTDRAQKMRSKLVQLLQ